MSKKTSDLDRVLAEIRKKFPGAVFGTMKDKEVADHVNYGRVPTIDQLDKPLGGGIPIGKVTVAWGPESSGKTALALRALANWQAASPDKLAVIIDAENMMDVPWFKIQGVDTDRLIIIGPGVFEDQANQLIHFIDSYGEQIGFVLLDSVGALVTRAEYQGNKKSQAKLGTDDIGTFNMHQDNVAVLARKLGQFLKVTNIHISRHKITTFIITHVYQNINSPGGGMIRKGGNALGHWAHVSMKMYSMRDKAFEEDVLCADGESKKIRTGYWVVVELDKTKQSAYQNTIIRVPFKLGIGFDSTQALLNSAKGYGVIDVRGSWYYWGEEKLGQGVAAVVERLKSDDDLRLKLRDALMTALEADEVFAR